MDSNTGQDVRVVERLSGVDVFVLCSIWRLQISTISARTECCEAGPVGREWASQEVVIGFENN